MKKIMAAAICAAMLLAACSPASSTGTSSEGSTSYLTESGWVSLPTSSSVESANASSTPSVSSSAVSSETRTSAASTAESSLASSTVKTSSAKTSPAAVKDEPGTLQMMYVPKYAKGFSIEYYYGGAKIIATDIKATANTAAVSQRVLILPAGATTPKNVKWDHKIDGSVNAAVTLASSHAGHFGNLNAINVVKGTSIKADSCFISSLKEALTNGSSKYVGSGTTADKELIVSLKPQIVFVGGMQSDIDLAHKLEESGLYCFYFGDFAEDHYMGRAQWIELIGAFIGKEQEGQDFIRNSESHINAIIARAAKIDKKPKVLWFTHSTQAPHWNLRTSSDYVNSIVSALGGQLYFPPDAKGNSITLSNEDFLQYMNGADKIIFGVSLNSYKNAGDIMYFNKSGQIQFGMSKAYGTDDCYVVGYDWAQDTADALGIIKSMAVCLYPDEFKDLTNTTKIIKFRTYNR